jgi:hypothetical protein
MNHAHTDSLPPTQEAAMNQMLKTMMAKQGMPMPPAGG